MVEPCNDLRGIGGHRRVRRNDAGGRLVAVGEPQPVAPVNVVARVVGGELADAEALGQSKDVILCRPDERRPGLRDLPVTEVMVVRSPTDAIARLEHDDGLAVAMQLGRGGQPRKPGADDRDVNLMAVAPVTRSRERPGGSGERGAGPGGRRGSNKLASAELAFLAQAGNSPSGGHPGQTPTGASAGDGRKTHPYVRESIHRGFWGLGLRPYLPESVLGLGSARAL